MEPAERTKHLKNHRLLSVLLFVVSLTFVLVIQGAIPFLTAPTLGQAIWTAGFGQSFINKSLLNIHAYNFGAPVPAAIAFGLTGAWPTGLFIKLGLPPIDAYTLMAAVWLTISFTAAFATGRYFSLSPKLSTLAAIAWGTMPTTWANSGYSMLSLGFSLLPLYILSSLKLFHTTHDDTTAKGFSLACTVTFFLLSCIVSVFMDGYSFVMFATASSILGGGSFIKNHSFRRFYLNLSIPVHVIGFALAYLLYTRYVGRSEFEIDPLDSIRSGGVDLTFLAVPTKGISWIMDTLGASIPRSDRIFFGDAAVWNTTYILPSLLASGWALFRSRKQLTQILPVFLCLIFASYMALGPSLKLNSKKPPGQETMGMMSASYAICTTGSGFFYQHVPGVKNMRCCYRWTALTVLCAWIIVIQSASSKRKNRTWPIGLSFSLIAFTNLPNLPLKLRENYRYRASFYELEHDWVDDMRRVVRKGERVAFLPWRNDFLATYLAPRLEIITYNTGGDKNLAEARRHWPKYMRGFSAEKIDEHFPERILALLEAGEADRVILPYVDFRWAVHQWPYPLEFKGDIQKSLLELRKIKSIEIENRRYYTSIKLASLRQ